MGTLFLRWLNTNNFWCTEDRVTNCPHPPPRPLPRPRPFCCRRHRPCRPLHRPSPSSSPASLVAAAIDLLVAVAIAVAVADARPPPFSSFPTLLPSSRIRGKMEHVYGHSDEYLSETEMSHDQRINCRADKLAPGGRNRHESIYHKHLPSRESLRRDRRYQGDRFPEVCNIRAMG